MNLAEQSAALLMGLAIFLGLIRMMAGPTNPDRLVAADTLTVITTVALTGFAALFASPLYLDVALIYGVLSFVGMVALARAIEGNRS